MLQAFATPRNRTVSVLLLVACGLLALAAARLGISDNPPGIVLAFLSIAAFFAALAHGWRRARPFWLLACGALASLVVLSALTILFDISAAKTEPGGPWASVLRALSRVCMVAAMACPSALLVGAVGGIVALVRTGRRPHTAA
jgi:uncharacterized membrane protein (UPF0136 family)